MKKFSVFLIVILVVFISIGLFFNFSKDIIGEYHSDSFNFYYRINYTVKGNTSFFFERNGKCIEVGNFWGMEYFEKPTIFRNENRETYYLFIEARYKNLLFIFYDYEPETQYENYNKNA